MNVCYALEPTSNENKVAGLVENQCLVGQG